LKLLVPAMSGAPSFRSQTGLPWPSVSSPSFWGLGAAGSCFRGQVLIGRQVRRPGLALALSELPSSAAISSAGSGCSVGGTTPGSAPGPLLSQKRRVPAAASHSGGSCQTGLAFRTGLMHQPLARRRHYRRLTASGLQDISQDLPSVAKGRHWWHKNPQPPAARIRAAETLPGQPSRIEARR